MTVKLFAANNTVLVDNRKLFGQDGYEVPYNVKGAQPGMYVLVIQAEGEQHLIKMVIN